MASDHSGEHAGDGHGRDDHAGHRHHGHAHDRGIGGAVRYLRWLPQMWRSEVNDAVVDRIAPAAGQRVLDIGAGMGPGALRAAATGARVVAVEPTPFMRYLLTARCLAGRHRRSVDVVDGAAELIPVESGVIDAIWSVNTMHHWLDPQRAATEIGRVLRPGGRVLLVDEDFDDPTHPEHERFAAEHHRGGDDHHGVTAVDPSRGACAVTTRAQRLT